MHVYKAISDVTRKLAEKGIKKTQKNEYHGYYFRGIDDLYNALGPCLADCNLVILPRVVVREFEKYQNRSGVTIHVVLQVEFSFISTIDDSRHVVTVFGEGADTSDKATNKAFSAAYKYACLQVFCVPVNGTVDADNESPVLGETQKKDDKKNKPKEISNNPPEWYDEWKKAIAKVATLDALKDEWEQSPKEIKAWVHANRDEKIWWENLKGKFDAPPIGRQQIGKG